MEFGKIEGNVLKYKGTYYEIRYVSVGCLVLKTDKLFGKFGDEFPLDKVR